MRSRRLFSILSTALLAASTLATTAFAGARGTATGTVSVGGGSSDAGQLLDSPGPNVDLSLQPAPAGPVRVARPQWTPANQPLRRPFGYGLYAPLSAPGRRMAPAAGTPGYGFGTVPHRSSTPVRPAYGFRHPVQTGYSYGWLPRSPLSFGFVPQSPASYGGMRRPFAAYGHLGAFAGRAPVMFPRRYGMLPVLHVGRR